MRLFEEHYLYAAKVVGELHRKLETLATTKEEIENISFDADTHMIVVTGPEIIIEQLIKEETLDAFPEDEEDFDEASSDPDSDPNDD